MKPAEFTAVANCPECGADIKIVRNREMTTAEGIGLLVGILVFFISFVLVTPFIHKYLERYFRWCERRFDC